jgi:hypothetical protein
MARHTTPMISPGSLGLSCVRGARRELTEEANTSVRIIIMLWTARSCRRRQCRLWLKRKHSADPAGAPKLRQNRFKYSSTVTHLFLRFWGQYAAYTSHQRVFAQSTIRASRASISKYVQSLFSQTSRTIRRLCLAYVSFFSLKGKF